MPRAASSAARPRVVNGPDRQRSRSHSASSPERNSGFMTPNLPRRKRARLSLQQPPLRHAGRADPQSPTNRPDRLAGLKALKRSFAKFFRIGSGHPCWPHIPSMDLELHLSCFANPDSAKNQRALEALSPLAVLCRWTDCLPRCGAPTQNLPMCCLRRRQTNQCHHSVRPNNEEATFRASSPIATRLACEILAAGTIHLVCGPLRPRFTSSVSGCYNRVEPIRRS